MKTPPPSAIDKPSHGTEKVNPPSLTDEQVLIEERIDNYAITNLPNEIIEMILVDEVNSLYNSVLYRYRSARYLIVFLFERCTSLTYSPEIFR